MILTALIFLFSLSTLTSIGVTRSLNEGGIAARFSAKQQAFYLAESGADVALNWFKGLSGPVTETTPFDPILDEACSATPTGTLNAGTYTICVTPDATNPTREDDLYTVTVTATTTGATPATRNITLVTKMESFSRYGWFTDTFGSVYMNWANGPVHTNNQLNLFGAFPWFQEEVSSVSTSLNCWGGCAPPYGSNPSGSRPSFNKGLVLGAAPITKPSSMTRLQTSATVTLTGDTTIQFQGTTLLINNPSEGVFNQVMPTDQTIYVADGNVTLAGGEVNGQLTIGTNRTILINNSVTYACSPWMANFDPDCKDGDGNVAYNDDVLGLVAKQNVLVAQSAPSTMRVEASVMALDGSFTIQNLSSVPVKSFLAVYGGVIQRTLGPWRLVNSSLVTIAGYSFGGVYYDARLLALAPPNFPTTGQIQTVLWQAE